MHQTIAARFVYLASHNGLHKIGSSADPVARLSQIAPGGDGELLHAFSSANAYAVENALHRRFASERAGERGREWFRLTSEEVDAICRLGQVDAVNDLPDDLRPAHEYAIIRIDADIVRKLTIAAAARYTDVSSLASPLLRDSVEQLYAEVVRELGEDVAK